MQDELVADNGCDQTNKILGESNDWFLDGTFKLGTAELLQMYSIHGRFEGHFLRCVIF